MNKADWVWMPHPGHFIAARDCRFFLNTYVGNYIVSTVGEYFPDSQVREIHADSRGIKLEGRGDARAADFLKKCGFIELGLNRIYETMVFAAQKAEDGCCPYRQRSGIDVDFAGYNDAGDAHRGHLAMCEKWADQPEKPLEEGELTPPMEKLRQAMKDLGISRPAASEKENQSLPGVGAQGTSGREDA